MKYGISHKDNLNEYKKREGRSRRERDPIRYLFNQCKYRANKLGRDFDIDLEWLRSITPEVCPVFGIPLFFSPGNRTDNSYSIDRLDNDGGYTKENTRVISFKANQYKGNLTIEEVENLLKYMKGNS